MQHRTVLIISPLTSPDKHHSSDAVYWRGGVIGLGRVGLLGFLEQLQPEKSRRLTNLKYSRIEQKSWKKCANFYTYAYLYIYPYKLSFQGRNFIVRSFLFFVICVILFCFIVAVQFLFKRHSVNTFHWLTCVIINVLNAYLLNLWVLHVAISFNQHVWEILLVSIA